MKIGVVQFPGSNCDQDCLRALTDGLEFEADYLWHKETSVVAYDGIILPGGFSYGDYLRCGAIARFSPIMRAVVAAAQGGMPILGICNGFQILCEVGLLPGALIRNQSLLFVCQPVWIRVETSEAPCTRLLKRGQKLRLPVAHGEGSYIADEKTLNGLESKDQIIFRYVDSSGDPTPAADDRHVLAAADSGGILLLSAPRRPGSGTRRLRSARRALRRSRAILTSCSRTSTDSGPPD